MAEGIEVVAETFDGLKVKLEVRKVTGGKYLLYEDGILQDDFVSQVEMLTELYKRLNEFYGVKMRFT